MPSKFDRLRSGEVVEIEPGRKGRLNLQNKTFETSDGRSIYVGDDVDFFPPNEEALSLSREKERIERQIKKTPGGEFLYQFGQQGLAGAAKDTINYIIQKGDDYTRNKQAQSQISQRISKESPITSAAATAASFVPDIALTHGMPAVKAAPILTAAHAGPRIVQEPGEVAQEALLSTAGGFLIDKGAQALNKIAQRRGQVRELPLQQAAVKAENVAGQQAIEEANVAQKQQFNMLKSNVKTENEARLAKYQSDLEARQNKIIQDKNDFDQLKAQRDAEVIRLENQARTDKMQRNARAKKSEADYKAAKALADEEDKRMAEKFKLDQKKYDEDLKRLPQLQKQAQAEYSANVVKNASEIEKSFPKSSKISSDDLGLAPFIDEQISKTGLGGSREASQAKRVLSSIFPEGEYIGGRELAKRYKALEDAIQRANPEVQGILKNFKDHLGQTLPNIIEDSVAYSRIVPLLKKNLESDVKSVLDSMKFEGKGLQQSKEKIFNIASTNARNFLKRDITPSKFVEKLTSGEINRDISNSVLSVEDFLAELTDTEIKHLQKKGTFDFVFKEMVKRHAFFVQELSDKVRNRLMRYEIKAMDAAGKAKNKLTKEIKGTFGLAEPVSPPVAPLPPSPTTQPPIPPYEPPVPPIQLPPPIAPPPRPPKPTTPSLVPEPSAPIPQTFTPKSEPTLAPPEGVTENIADVLEQSNLLGGKELLNNPLLKLGGLKYLLGKAAVPAEAAYMGLKGLTAPGAAGEAARMTFKQGGIQAIESWASKYPSYHDGILENPQERRALTKEIEDSPDIPLELKAVIQSKVNRGKPLQQPL